MSKKVRIVERVFNGNKKYVIQQKHFLFRWWWVDAWINSDCGASCVDTFSTIGEAKENLVYFDGTKPTEEEVASI